MPVGKAIHASDRLDPDPDQIEVGFQQKPHEWGSQLESSPTWAVDDLAAGQSTFGRDGSDRQYSSSRNKQSGLARWNKAKKATFNGLSITWAVSEYSSGDLKSRTIFATLYHELIKSTEQRKKFGQLQSACAKSGEDLIFLDLVSPGGASRSYGIKATRLAGIPATVVQRAKQVLDQLAT